EPPLSAEERAHLEAISRQRALAVLGPWIGDAVAASGECSRTQLRARLGVVSRHDRLFELIVHLLVAEGWLAEGAHGLRCIDRARRTAPVTAAVPRLSLLIRFLERCLDGYIATLTGHIEPLALLFPGGSARELETLYAEAASFRYFNRRLGAAIADL